MLSYKLIFHMVIKILGLCSDPIGGPCFDPAGGPCSNPMGCLSSGPAGGPCSGPIRHPCSGPAGGHILVLQDVHVSALHVVKLYGL